MNIEFGDPPDHQTWHSVVDSVVWVEKGDKVTVSRTDTRRGRKKDVKLVFRIRIQDNDQSELENSGFHFYLTSILSSSHCPQVESVPRLREFPVGLPPGVRGNFPRDCPPGLTLFRVSGNFLRDCPPGLKFFRIGGNFPRDCTTGLEVFRVCGNFQFDCPRLFAGISCGIAPLG